MKLQKLEVEVNNLRLKINLIKIYRLKNNQDKNKVIKTRTQNKISIEKMKI